MAKIPQRFVFLSLLLLIFCVILIPIRSETPAESVRIASVTPEQSGETPPPHFQLRTVVIDPGHGGRDPGYVSTNGVKEKQINLPVAKKLARELKKRKFNVHILRESDQTISLEQRGLLANTHSSLETLLLSIHCNSWVRQSASGVETYVFDFEPSDEDAARVALRENAGEELTPINFILRDLNHRGSERYSSEAARIIQRNLVERLDARDRHVRRAPLRILGYVQVPAVLVELGFLSHPKEEKKLRQTSYQERVAVALAEAIIEFRASVAQWKDGNGSP